MPSGTQNQKNLDFRAVFQGIQTIAVVGYSDKRERAGHYVPEYMAKHGYTIIAVNPKFAGSVDGFPCFPSLSAIPAGTRVDAIDVFRAPEYAEALVDEAAQMEPRPSYFWMQPGAENPSAARKAIEVGITPIMDACMLAEHRSLFGS
jgi:predicted CoA-binding protein